MSTSSISPSPIPPLKVSNPALMPVNVFVSSPADVQPERVKLEAVIRELNETVAHPMGLQLMVKDWAKDVSPLIRPGVDAQQVINAQIGDYNIFLGMMWKRLGSPTPRAESGTVEEFNIALERCMAAGTSGTAQFSEPRVMFYFSNKPIPPQMSAGELEQLKQVQEFRARVSSMGVYTAFKNLKDFEALTRRHLSALLHELRRTREAEQQATTLEASGVATSPSHTSTPGLPSGATNSAAPPVTLKSLIQPEDWALLVNFQTASPLTPPKDVPDWGALGFERIVSVPRVHSQDRPALLRTFPITPPALKAWTDVGKELEAALKQIEQGCRGALHVFMIGSHATAALMGRRLDDINRLQQVYLHQYDDRVTKDWMPFGLPPGMPGLPAPVSFFSELESRDALEDGQAIILCVEGFTPIRFEQLDALIRQERVQQVYWTKPRADREFKTLAQARGAIEQLKVQVAELYALHPDAPIHLVTTAPVALLIELGRLFKPTVYSRVVVHTFDNSSRTYFPTLDLIGPKFMLPRRSRFQILDGDGGIFYRLEDQVLLATRQVTDGLKPVPRRDPSMQVLMEAARTFSQAMLPESVESAIESIEQLDIEISLQEDAADLSWEFLHLRKRDQLAALRPGWTLTRFLRSGEALAYHPTSSVVKVLIAPVLPKAEQAACESWLKLNEIKGMKGERFDVRILPFGSEFPAVQAALRDFQPDIFQWIGHGQADDLEAQPGVTQIQQKGRTRPLHRGQFRQLLENVRPPRVVLMCACSVGEEPEAYGIPRDLIVDGVGAVISFRDPVRVGEVGVFSEAFYRSILKGESIRQAVREGRGALHFEAEPNGLLPGAFGAPLLSCYDERAVGVLLPAPPPGGPDLPMSTLPDGPPPPPPSGGPDLPMSTLPDGPPPPPPPSGGPDLPMSTLPDGPPPPPPSGGPDLPMSTLPDGPPPPPPSGG